VFSAEKDGQRINPAAQGEAMFTTPFWKTNRASRRTVLAAAAAGLAGSLSTEWRQSVSAGVETPTNAGIDPSSALFQLASSIVSSLTETHYSHDIYINAAQGIYDTNCSGFVDYLVQRIAPAPYRLVPKEPGHVRPRAFMYEQFFSHLEMGIQAPGWTYVEQLSALQPGDILAWELIPVQQYYDTGHMVVVAAPPLPVSSGVMSLPVIDSSALRHYDDSRPRGTNGVGTGQIHFQIDDGGSPLAFQFDVGGAFHQTQISMGRLVAT
jgi:hypothetical protein